ncbi:MAG: M28 family peptidase [Paludibacteraceae bacterium]|nr:M28 family peptidase [Paludibacteraceae bacterium]MBP5481036.1 M28 family peptidase [Paludibacteraceae bacterium]
MQKRLVFASLLATAVTFSSCTAEANTAEIAPETEQKEEEKSTTEIAVPNFSEDSAYQYVVRQCEFGPRVPNSDAHEQCAAYLGQQLTTFGAEVTKQAFTATAFDGTALMATNIIGTFYPEKSKRVILFSHWDSRPFCDQGAPQDIQKAVMGANDGASGVAILLEIARILKTNEPNVGVDIVMLDVEDYGDARGAAESWCLGSQYWAKQPHYKTKPEYGILLDMVGGQSPSFGIDIASQQLAQSVASKVWNTAHALGYQQFKNEISGQLIDDHVFVNMIAGIPTIDIIDYSPERGFPATWHTTHDTPENISKETLGMVGKVVTKVIFSE